MRRRLRDDDGSIMVLTLGFAVIALALVLVVADASKVFLTRRSLVSAADGAALAGVQSLDRDAFYRGDGGDVIPLEAAAASAAVRQYVADAGLAAQYTDLEVVAVDVAANEVSVTLRARSLLPFGSYVGHPDGVVIEATAHATAPYAD